MRLTATLLTLLLTLSALAQSPEELQTEFFSLYEKEKYAEAAPVGERWLKLCRETYGAEDLKTADAAMGLGMLYYMLKDHNKAVHYLGQSAPVFRAKVPADDKRLAIAAYYLGLNYYKIKQFDKALPWLELTLPGREERLGEWGLAEHLMALSVCYWSAQDHPSAVPVLERLVVVKEAKKAEDLADWMGYLGKSLKSVGNYRQAVTVYKRALEARNEGDTRTASLLSGLGEAQIWTADYAGASANLERALSIQEAQLGPKHTRTVETVGHLAQLYYSMSDSVRAREFYTRYLSSLGAQGQQAALVKQVGDLLYSTGYRSPEKTLVHIDGLIETYQRVAPGDRTLVALKALRGVNLRGALRLREAADVLEPLLPKLVSTFGAQSPLLGPVYEALAFAQMSVGELSEAEALLRQGLELQLNSVGPNHPATSWSMLMLAITLDLQGKREQSREMALRQTESSERVLENILAFASERQRLAFLSYQYPYILASLGFGEECAQVVLRRKGVVLDSIVEDLRLAKASNDPRFGELQRAKRQIIKNGMLGKDTSTLEREAEQLESGLARTVGQLGRPRRALSVTVPQVQKMLSADSVLVEYFRYTSAGKNLTPVDHYGAVLIGPRGKPAFFPMGEATEIDKQLRKAQRAVRRQGNSTPALQVLHQKLWEPLEGRLPEGTKTVVISPDSELNRLSFAILINSELRFLCERYQLRYVSSGRDLLNQPKPTTQRNMLVVANPDYTALSAEPGKKGSHRGIARMSFDPLPGTHREAKSLESLAAEKGWVLELLEGEQATEQAVRTRTPAILHLATHGFFRSAKGDTASAQTTLFSSVYDFDRSLGDLDGPLYRSGLALAGAQATMDAWKDNRGTEPESDGVLTAQEVGTLNLSQTWLVTLSACDTGLGQLRGGEGVLGLRRALVQAGAHNMLVTLWPVDDQQTAQFMTDFYREALANQDPPTALAKVQRQALVQLTEKVGRNRAVYLAGPFLVSSQGPLARE